MVTAFNQWYQLYLSGQAFALLGQEAENNFIDCKCRNMSHLISANGIKDHALLIDFDSLTIVSVNMYSFMLEKQMMV